MLEGLCSDVCSRLGLVPMDGQRGQFYRSNSSEESPRRARLGGLAALLSRFAPCGAYFARLRRPPLALSVRQDADAGDVDSSSRTGASEDTPSDSSKPLVSAIVPTLDRSERVERAVESVREQTYPNLELIVVDDSAQPNELLRSRDFDDLARFEYVHRGDPRGLADARNRGIEEAEGDLIAFLDDDDRWEPEKTTRQVERFEDGDVGLCSCRRYMVEADDSVRNVAGCDLAGDATKKVLCRNVVGPPSGVMVAREPLDAAGAFDPDFDLWEDREWYLRVAQVAEIDCVEEPLIRYAVDTPEKMSGNRRKVREDAYPALFEKHADLLASYGPLERREIEGWRHHKLGLMATESGDRADGTANAVRAIATYPLAWPFYRLLVRSVLGGRLYATAETLLGRANRPAADGT